MQNINKNINVIVCRPTPRRKSDGGLSFHRVGKGKGVERLEIGYNIGGLVFGNNNLLLFQKNM
jgi:hypothetical protein